MPENILHCVGCGNGVCPLPEPGQMLAISCRCGAYSPILVRPDLLDAAEPVATMKPASVIRVQVMHEAGLRVSGHWENHLGPEPRTIVGRAWKTYLIECGLTSMADCHEDRCQCGIERMRQRQ